MLRDLQIKIGRLTDNVASSGNGACAVGAASYQCGWSR